MSLKERRGAERRRRYGAEIDAVVGSKSFLERRSVSEATERRYLTAGRDFQF